MVYVQMSVPIKNANGPGPVAVDHLEIYAVTAAPGAVAPGNRDLLASTHVIGRIPVKPPPNDEEQAPGDNEPKDTRPAPGETVTFVETLGEAQLKPEILPAPKTGAATAASRGSGGTTGTPPPTPAAAAATPAPPTAAPEEEEPSVPPTSETPAAGTPPTPGSSAVSSSQTTAAPAPPPGSPPAATPAPAPAAAIVVESRIYVVRGVTKRGRPGSPSARLIVPLIPPPPRATALTTSFSETAARVSWLPPVVEIGSGATKIAYNVYAAAPASESSQVEAVKPGDLPTPLNDKLLDVTSFEHAGAQPGVQQCFVVRTVETVATAIVESEPSERACVTPRDIFPPAAPKALSAVAGPGAINLIWDANAEADIAGYVILRAEAPGDTLQPLNTEPTRETRYRDTTATPGTRYVYAIVAVDRAGNRSPASPRVEETAR